MESPQPRSGSAAASLALEDTQNKAWAKDKTKFGYKMLQKMGWSEGKGLGKHEHGMQTHVKIDKKTSREGLGAENDATGDNTLSRGFHAFNSLLTNLSAQYSNVSESPRKSTSKKKKKKSKSDNDDSEEKSRSWSVSATEETSSEQTYTSKGLHYKRFLHNKRVSNYSKRDLSAILGVVHHDNAQPDGTSLENGFAVSPEGEFLGNQESEQESESTLKEKKKDKKKKKREAEVDTSAKKAKKRKKEKK